MNTGIILFIYSALGLLLCLHETKAQQNGFIFISGDDTDWHLGASGGAAGYPTLNNAMITIVQKCVSSSGLVNAPKAILAIGINPNLPYAYNYAAFTQWTSSYKNSFDIIVNASQLMTANFSNYKMIYIPSQKSIYQGSLGNSSLCDIETALVARKLDIQNYVNVQHGSIMAFEQTAGQLFTTSAFPSSSNPVIPVGGVLDGGCPNAFAWFPLALTSTVFEVATVSYTSAFTSALASTSISSGDLNHQNYHLTFTGPPVCLHSLLCFK